MKIGFVAATALSLTAIAFAGAARAETAAPVAAGAPAATAPAPAAKPVQRTAALAAPATSGAGAATERLQPQKSAAAAEDPKLKRLAALRTLASRTSMRYLPRLKPYASDYRRLVSAVLGYWRGHTANPNANQLTDIIMRHVRDEYRFFARPQILAGVSEGVAVLRAELRKL